MSQEYKRDFLKKVEVKEPKKFMGRGGMTALQFARFRLQEKKRAAETVERINNMTDEQVSARYNEVMNNRYRVVGSDKVYYRL